MSKYVVAINYIIWYKLNIGQIQENFVFSDSKKWLNI